MISFNHAMKHVVDSPVISSERLASSSSTTLYGIPLEIWYDKLNTLNTIDVLLGLDPITSKETLYLVKEGKSTIPKRKRKRK